jgi:hypothetical protein
MKSKTKFHAVLSAAIFFLLLIISGGPAGGQEQGPASPLQIVPESLEIGTLSPGGYVKGILFMKSTVSADMSWSTRGPGGWSSSGSGILSGRMKDFLGYMEIGIRFMEDENQEADEDVRQVQMIIESEGETLTLLKSMPFGDQEEEIPVLFEGGEKIVSVRFSTALREPGPEINVEPPGIDFGTVEGSKTVVRKLRIRNTGKGALHWKLGLQGDRQEVDGVRLRKGMYLSLLNEECPAGGPYRVPGRLADHLQLTGLWLSADGYPASNGDETLRYVFTGTGIAVIVRPDEDGGRFKAFVDDVPAAGVDCYSEDQDRSVVIVAENLPEGSHVLTLVNDGGYAEIEGLRVYGTLVLDGTPGWINIFPTNGTARSQTNYVTVTVATENLKSGTYSENILVQSNAGLAVVEASLRVTRDVAAKIIDVYRYVKGRDYLYTGHPEMENPGVIRTYRKQSLAFRLFREDTPGTRKFFRWYNATRGDHYYSSDPGGGGKSLQGYVQEGSIGNIATSRILGTRELYRWYNPSTGCHFYTTDVKGEGMARKGYRFEGIAGYVR